MRQKVTLVLFPALFAATLTLGVLAFTILPGEIAQSGMGPEFSKGDKIWVDTATPRLLEYRVGEIVSVRSGSFFPHHGALMRVVALPGAHVERPDSSALNSDEFLLQPVGDKAAKPLLVVERSLIRGRVVLRIAPLKRLAWRPGQTF